MKIFHQFTLPALMALCQILFAFPIFATPTVTSATAKQRFPWNGLVDITCTVSGFDRTSGMCDFTVAAVMPDSGEVRSASYVWVVQDGTNSTNLAVCGNGNYHFLWDARADLGEVRYTNMVIQVTIHDKVQLWEGGPYWATTNVGATEPWGLGFYFWWGDTIGYNRKNDMWVANDGSSTNFSFCGKNTPTSGRGIWTLLTDGWVVQKDGAYVLSLAHDAAHVHWGGNWRMPTYQELHDLNDKCVWTWTTKNGVGGYAIRGRDAYASASIFLPHAASGWETSLIGIRSSGYYWSSVPYGDDNSWSLDFDSDYHGTYSAYCSRAFGLSVRPVQGFAE